MSPIEETNWTLWLISPSTKLDSRKARALESSPLPTACESLRRDISRLTSFLSQKGGVMLVELRTQEGRLEVPRWAIHVRTAGPDFVPREALDQDCLHAGCVVQVPATGPEVSPTVGL